MDHRENRSEIAKCLAALVAMTVSLPKQLRPYQMETIVSMIRWLEDPEGSRRAYVAHATGMGKTTLFASMITACAGLRILVVVPSKVLVEQTVRELYTFTGGMIGHVSSLSKIKDADGEVIAMKGHDLFDVVVVTDASLARHGRKLAKEFNPHLVIRDECHWTYAEKRQKVMDFYPESVTVGFSATPDYLTTQARSTFVPVTLDNGQVLYAPEDRIARAHYSTCLDERTVRWGIEEGHLAPLAWGHVEFDISLDNLRTADGDCGPDFREEDLHALLEKKWQFMQDTIVELYKSGEYGLRDRQVFAVCHGVEAADRLSDALRSIGVNSACITGKTRDVERNAILSAFQSGAIKFLSSVMVLREGWNAPNAEVCLMLRPTKSRVFYVQSMGRVLRPSEDGSSKVALVIDALYQNTAFAPLSAPVLFGYPGQEVSSGDILINAHGDASRVKESPYKTGLVKPKLVTVEAMQIEYWADASGCVRLEGELWGTIKALCRKLSISETPIRSRLDASCRTMEARDSSGKRTTFYALSDVERVCKDLLDPTLLRLPEAESFVEADGEMWGTLKAVQEKLGLSYTGVTPRLDSSCRTREGIDGGGRRTTFYALSDVERVCKDLLDPTLLRLPEAESFVEADGEMWGTLNSYACKLGIQESSIKARVERDGACQTRSGKDSVGKIVTLYASTDITRACHDLLEAGLLRVPTGESFVEAHGETWASLKSAMRLLGLSRAALVPRLKDSCRVHAGIEGSGKRTTLYALSDLRRVCADLLDVELLRVPSGALFVEHEGVTWGTLKAASGKLGLSYNTVRLATNGKVRTRAGKDPNGIPQRLYAFQDVEAVCDYLVKLKREGKRPIVKRDPAP